jgi:hypothetical protein
MNESIFFFVQEANDFRGELEQLLGVLFDGCLAAEFHPLLTIFHSDLPSRKPALRRGSRFPEARDVPSFYFLQLAMSGGRCHGTFSRKVGKSALQGTLYFEFYLS